MNAAKPILLGICFLLFASMIILAVTDSYRQYQYAPDYPSNSKQVKPQRIVSLSPGNTEILFALGAGDRVVGVTSYSDYPKEASDKPSIGGYDSPDVEKIIALSPDVVIAAGDIQQKQVSVLKKVGIRVVSVEPHTLEEVLSAIDKIGQQIGESERATILLTQLANRLHAIEQINSRVTRKRVFVQVWDVPLLTIGSKSFISDIVKHAGGINVAATKDTDYTPSDIETLYAYNPEVYVIISNGSTENVHLPETMQLLDIAAVRNKQIFQIDGDLLARPGPRCFIGFEQLAVILHPN